MHLPFGHKNGSIKNYICRYLKKKCKEGRHGILEYGLCRTICTICDEIHEQNMIKIKIIALFTYWNIKVWDTCILPHGKSS